ncbi:protoheme IX farnesyltransferase [Caldisphaera lagunensis DSM 15908]|uniref:Protoheme IX farnesyltransferase n=1 Tax=Caldisphaera lagunensis (strain DSM 15908 / JCM 11604 / ANMR 0165 / IC-154) TaxID=1056495 RepID=L0A8W9_CALLD|nr:heme o synthase [Caldisphaera lagunensis]AFZ70301.1 protoheme IX farnesyltransferase [Caldisphaera lagunensis DSM 15908]
MSFIKKAKALFNMTKPAQMGLLLITVYGAYFAAGTSINIRNLLLLLPVGIGGIGGVTALNMYLEVDIDSIMARTRKRPLPSKQLSNTEAIVGIILLILIGIIAADFINKYVVFAIIMGLFFDIIGYTELTKRTTATNILFGGIAGAMPSLGGWAAATGYYGIGGILLALIVLAWIPMHIWFIVYYNIDDYKNASIPMLPVISNEKTFGNIVVFSIISLAILSWLFYFLEGRGMIAASLSTILVIIALLKINKFMRYPSKNNALSVFKFANSVIAVVFVLARFF